jgi:hypothetical protein
LTVILLESKGHGAARIHQVFSMKYKSTITRREATLALAAAATGIGGSPVRAQAKYPNRPVRVILPFGAGGVADVTARLVAEALGSKLTGKILRDPS